MFDTISLRDLVSLKRPFFLYVEQVLQNNIAEVQKMMQSILGSSVSLSFSLKTQPNYRVIEQIRKNNLSLDVSSYNELIYAEVLGFACKKIFLGGVGLTDQAIQTGLSMNIGAIHLNSIETWKIAAEMKKGASSNTKLTIRFHPDYLKGSKIGENFDEVIRYFRGQKILNGLHIYIGRDSFEEAIVKKVFDDILVLSQNQVFQDDWTLYFGPGLSDFSQFTPQIFSISHSIPNIKIEVGRSMVSSCGYYGAPVLSVKQFNTDKKTVIIDGGLQHFGSPWVTLRHGPMKLATYFCDSNGNHKKTSSATAAIYGSLCLWHDCLHPNLQIPGDLSRGDWIVVPHMGAYGLSAGVPLFIGETLPIEFYFDGNAVLNVTHDKFGKSSEE